MLAVLELSGCSGGGSPTGVAPARPRHPEAAKSAAPSAASAAPVKEFVYDAGNRRDPFQPLIKPKEAGPKARPKTGLAALDVDELKLAGIIWGRQGFYALVEASNGAGYVLRVNDVIGEDARVTKITPDAVTFEVKPETFLPKAQARLVELRLRKEE